MPDQHFSSPVVMQELFSPLNASQIQSQLQLLGLAVSFSAYIFSSTDKVEAGL